MGIEYVIPSSSEFTDSWEDNWAISMELTKKTGLLVITNGNIWQEKQYKAIKKSKVFGIRLHSIGSLRNIFGV